MEHDVLEELDALVRANRHPDAQTLIRERRSEITAGLLDRARAARDRMNQALGEVVAAGREWQAVAQKWGPVLAAAQHASTRDRPPQGPVRAVEAARHELDRLAKQQHDAIPAPWPLLDRQELTYPAGGRLLAGGAQYPANVVERRAAAAQREAAGG